MTNQLNAMPTRREFLRVAATGVAFGALGGLSKVETALGQGLQKVDRPNILVIMADEHNASVTGCYGNKLVQTPHLDSLAARGVVFDACYTSSPLCVPARLAFTAGQYISRIGAWNNSCWIANPDVHTLPAILANVGYETVLCGKMHYDATHRYGFNIDISNGRNKSFMTGKGSRRDPGKLTPKPSISKRFTEDFRVGINNPVMLGDLNVTIGAAEYLKNRHKEDSPFFLLAGYVAPHFPLIVPFDYWLPYQDRVPMPNIPEGFLETLPRNYQHLRVAFDMEYVPDHLVKFGRELYYGFVQWLDKQIGMLLESLENSEVADNTIVIYTSDHGENLGEHGLWWKNAMYEQSARVPLIVSWPRRWTGGQRRTEACSHLDLVQTIAELAGVDAPAEWDGDSLCAWMDNAASSWKDLAISQYYAHNIASGFTMVRQERYKYVYHAPASAEYGAEHELYDLESDPGELRNLANDPAYADTRQRMFATLVQEIGEHPDQTELRCRAEIARGYGRQKPANYVAEEDD